MHDGAPRPTAGRTSQFSTAPSLHCTPSCSDPFAIGSRRVLTSTPGSNQVWGCRARVGNASLCRPMFRALHRRPLQSARLVVRRTAVDLARAGQSGGYHSSCDPPFLQNFASVNLCVTRSPKAKLWCWLRLFVNTCKCYVVSLRQVVFTAACDKISHTHGTDVRVHSAQAAGCAGKA